MNTLWTGFVTLMFLLPSAFGPAATAQPGPGCCVCCPLPICEPCPPDCCEDCCDDCSDDSCEAPAPVDGGCRVPGACAR